MGICSKCLRKVDLSGGTFDPKTREFICEECAYEEYNVELKKK
jgi:hypothetical protein